MYPRASSIPGAAHPATFVFDVAEVAEFWPHCKKNWNIMFAVCIVEFDIPVL